MERKITNEFLKWKNDGVKKPMFLYGTRQVGKTYSVLEFGEKYYKNIAYFDVSNNSLLTDMLEKEKILDRIITSLSLFSCENIFKGDTLIVFDNCDEIETIRSMKIFNNSGYDVIIIGSNRNNINKVHMSDFYYRQMMPLDFEEYLLNNDKVQLIDFIRESYDSGKAMPFHQMAMDAYNEYLICGGFPEVIMARLMGQNDLQIEAIKQKIINIYRSEYSKYDSDNANFVRSNEIINSMPLQLTKENRKFQYGMIKKGGRSKEYEGSINVLVANSILNRSYRLLDIKSPLSSVRDGESFKLYCNDVGLLYTMLHLNRTKFLNDSDVRRSLVENNVANTLVNNGYNLYYHQSDGKAEVGFVIQNRVGKIIPIDLVNMKLTKAKALSLFLAKYNLTDAIRITENNFSHKKGIKYIPLYATFCLKDI